MHLSRYFMFVLLTYLFSTSVWGVEKGIDESRPVLFYADTKTYDRELGILILKGNVEFAQDGNILEADNVSYNEKMDLVTASGNVRLRRPNGSISYAEYVELTGDMKEGIALYIRSLIENNRKIVAREARKFEDREEFDKGVYTACNICGNAAPVWQLNAERVVKDNAGNEIHFTDAQLRMFDVPVFYTPYLTSPLGRKSGFLFPSPGYAGKDLGATVQVPYFLVLSEDKDMTFIPVFFTKKSPLFKGEYRQAFGNGRFSLDGSITHEKHSKRVKPGSGGDIPKTRGHIYSTGEFALNEDWRFGFKGGYVSDQTFFRRYKYFDRSRDNSLDSKGYLEGFPNGTDYVALKTYHFQGLRAGDYQRFIADALPIIEYQAYSAPDRLGGRFSFNTQFLNLYRRVGTKYQRGITELGWRAPYFIPGGQLMTLFASLRGDIYNREDFIVNTVERNGVTGRFFPQGGVDWRWPFINTFGQQSIILEPIVQFVGGPNNANFKRIPQEDSVGFEFDDVNLLNPNRSPGYDLIDAGSRVNYAAQILTTGNVLGDISFFFGQSYAFNRVRLPGNNNTIKHGVSDWVGRIEASPWPKWFTANYRFRLDRDTWAHKFSEVSTMLGPPVARLTTSFLFVNKNLSKDKDNDFKQIHLRFSSEFAKYWSFYISNRHDFRKKSQGGGELSRGIGLRYSDECFTINFNIERTFYHDRDVRPGTNFLIVLNFVTLGELPLAYNFGRKGLYDFD